MLPVAFDWHCPRELYHRSTPGLLDGGIFFSPILRVL